MRRKYILFLSCIAVICDSMAESIAVPLHGNLYTGPIIYVNIDRHQLRLLVDTDSDHTVIKLPSQHNYTGSETNAIYSDGAAWYGTQTNMSVAVAGTNVTISTQVSVIETHSMDFFPSENPWLDTLRTPAFDGILGMRNTNVSFWSSYTQQYLGHSFALHLCPHNIPGQFWFNYAAGQYNTEFYSPLLPGTNSYATQLYQVSIGTTTIDTMSPITIDSGTSNLILPVSFARQIRRVLHSFTDVSLLLAPGFFSSDQDCVIADPAVLVSLPSINLHLHGGTISIPATDGYVSVSYTKQYGTVLCPAISQGDRFVLGYTPLQNKLTVFDTYMHQVGFVSAVCTIVG